MIAKTVKKVRLADNRGDFDYWRQKTPAERLAALESIRQEFNRWKYSDAEQRFQRVFAIVKQK
jgi:hypothetical protein